MAQTVLITLSIAGADTGPFDLYSNDDGFLVPFETGVTKTVLLSGYTSNLVPDAAMVIRVKSTSVLCPTFVDLAITTTTTTTTSTTTTLTTSTTTTTPPDPPTATLTISKYESGKFYFTLSAPIYSTNISITDARVQGYTVGSCGGTTLNISIVTSFTFLAGTTSANNSSSTPLDCTNTSYLFQNILVANGFTLNNGSTFTVGGTLVTVVIDSVTCRSYTC